MTKRLYRSKKGILGGVLAGLGNYFSQDPVLWRLGFIILLCVTGIMPFALIYLIAWVIIPLEPSIEPLTKEEYKEAPHE